jgi:hypothetical protein
METKESTKTKSELETKKSKNFKELAEIWFFPRM